MSTQKKRYINVTIFYSLLTHKPTWICPSVYKFFILNLKVLNRCHHGQIIPGKKGRNMSYVLLLPIWSSYYNYVEKRIQEPWVWLIWHAVYELREFINASVLQNKSLWCISSLTRVVSHGPLHYNIINTHKNERNNDASVIFYQRSN